MTLEQIANRIMECQDRLYSGMAMVKAGELALESDFEDKRHALKVETVASRTLEAAYGVLDDINNGLSELAQEASNVQNKLPASPAEGEGVES